MYKTLTGSGIPAADKLAEGLGKAAAGLDQALNTVGPAVMSAAQSVRQAQQNQQNQQTQQTRRPGQNVQGDGSYHYTYRYQGKNPAQGQPPKGAGQWGNVRPPQGVTPVPPPKMPRQEQAAPRAPVQAPAPQMKMVRAGSPMKYYITGVAAILYAMNFQMMEPSQWAVFAVVMLMVFLLSGALFKGKKQFVPIEEPKPQPKPEPKPEPKKEPEPEKKSSTGNPEVDKIIDEGHGYLRRLREANDAIPDEALSADIDRMERASADIFNYIAKHPGKAPQIRKFMSYYLPTTLKLLNSYEQLSKQSVKGENITSTMFNIAGMMHTVADAFEKQLDSLFTDEAMDISADITVFETMLKQEGFVEEKGTKLG